MSKNIEVLQQTQINKNENQNQYRNGVRNVTFALKNSKLLEIFPSSRYGTQDTLSDVQIVQIQGQDGDEQQQLGNIPTHSSLRQQKNYKQNSIHEEEVERMPQSLKQKNKKTNNFNNPHPPIKLIQKQQNERQLKIKYKYRNPNSNRSKIFANHNDDDEQQLIKQKYYNILRQYQHKQSEVRALKQANTKLAAIVKQNNRKYVEQIKGDSDDQQQEIKTKKQAKTYQIKQVINKLGNMFNLTTQQTQQVWKGALWAIITYLIIMCMRSLIKN